MRERNEENHVFRAPALDLQLFLFINQQFRLVVFDIIMPILSAMSALFAVMAAALAFAVFKGGKRQIVFFLILIAGMGLSDFSTGLMKSQIQRVRPLNAISGTHYVEDGEWRQRPADFVQTKENGTSYPSAHASTTMCIAILAILIWPALKGFPLILPLLVGYSRIYLGKHYPTDVLAGWLWGVMVAGVIWLLWREIRKRWMPDAR